MRKKEKKKRQKGQHKVEKQKNSLTCERTRDTAVVVDMTEAAAAAAKGPPLIFSFKLCFFFFFFFFFFVDVGRLSERE